MPPDDLAPPETGQSRVLSRRAVLLGAGAASATGLGGYALALGEATKAPVGAPSESPLGGAVEAAGEHQAGISRPSAPQQHCLLAVIDLELDSGPDPVLDGSKLLQSKLLALGAQIDAVTAPPNGVRELTPDGAGDLSVTVGLGADALAHTQHPELAELVDLPDFVGDALIPESMRGGGLLVSVNSSDPVVLEPVLNSLLDCLGSATIRWSQFGYRGREVDGIARNPFGYLDGIIRPKTSQEFQSDVWIADGSLAGGTICVVRKFQLDVELFRALQPEERDRVFGRTQLTGAPLSGGSRDDEVNLDAKSPNGSLLVPMTAHARAAHPAFTGSRLMLRRSYSYRNSALDHGHVFISYQNDVQTFVRTQLRLDETDALSRFVTPVATAAFAILPGAQDELPLGASLFSTGS